MYSILIVDDNSFDRSAINKRVDWKSLDIEVAGYAVNGLEGYQKAIDIKPDFILTDVAMPLMNGIEMTKKIKNDLPGVKVIFMSCFDEYDYVKSAINLDASSYILKPIDLFELKAVLEKVKYQKDEELKEKNIYNEIRKKLKMNIDLLREQFFNELITGRNFSEDEIRKQIQDLEIDNVGKKYTVIVIKVDGYEKLFKEMLPVRRYYLICDLRKTAEDILLNNNAGYIIRQSAGELGLLRFLNNQNDETDIKELLSALDEYKRYINKKHNTGITIGISDFSQRLSDIPLLYSKANYAVQFKFYSQGNRTIMASEVKKQSQSPIWNIHNMVDQINDLVYTGTKIEFEEFINKYFDEESYYSQFYFRDKAFTVVNMIQIVLSERNEQLESLLGKNLILWKELNSLETVQEIRSWILNILLSVKEFEDNKTGEHYKRIVEDIKQIIEKEYSTISNIDEIVDSIYISAGHASHIFKKQTGRTIWDYLVCKRVEKAKEMLLDPYMKIYEISEAVGYKSKSYFTSIFKEHTGMTPKQMRDKTMGLTPLFPESIK